MRFLVFCLALLSVAASYAQPLSEPAIGARAWILIDYATGQVLAAHEADTRLDPASLTKVMTTYLVADALAQKTLSLQQPVTVSERAWRTQGSRSFVPVNKGVLVDDLFKGMVIQSGNDASVALAEAIGGSEDAFAAMMNRTAQRMGLKDTNFLNASGYFEGAAPNHHSTARDLARLHWPTNRAVSSIEQRRSSRSRTVVHSLGDGRQEPPASRTDRLDHFWRIRCAP